jgi:hypothetical protein
MRLYINTENVQFTAQRNMSAKLDNQGKQKFDQRQNLPMWTIQANALDSQGGEIINITVVSEVKPDVAVGQIFVPEGLEALPWTSNRDNTVRSGVAFRATALRVLTPAS